MFGKEETEEEKQNISYKALEMFARSGCTAIQTNDGSAIGGGSDAWGTYVRLLEKQGKNQNQKGDKDKDS